MRRFEKNIIIASAALFVAILGVHRMPQLLVALGLMLGFIVFVRKKVSRDMQKAMIALFLITFLLQVAFSLYLYNTTVNTKYYGFSAKGDDYVYGDFGTIVGDLWRHGIFPTLKGLEYYNLIGEHVEVEKYQLYNAFIFFLFGKCGGQMLLVINCFFHAAIILPVYFLCKNLKMNVGPTIFTFLLFLFWPSTFYWSLFNFKEPIALFVLIAIFALAAKMKDSPDPGRLALLLCFIFMIYCVKKYIFVVSFSVFLYFLIYWKPRPKVIMAVSLSIILAILWWRNWPLFRELYIPIGNCPINFYYLRHPVPASTDYFVNMYTNSWQSMFFYFPAGVFAALFFPFMLVPQSLSHILVNIESIIWWALLPFLINGMWIAAKRHIEKTFHIILTLIVWIAILALTQGNMGTLLRQKSFLYYMAFIFIGLAIDRNYQKRPGPKGS